MKLIIAGGRDYQFTPNDTARLDELNLEHSITEVISGGTTGTDLCGETWAKKYSITVSRFSADWKTHGRAAGAMRNREMAEYADAVALFPGEHGMDSMDDEAQRAGLAIFDWR